MWVYEMSDEFFFSEMERSLSRRDKNHGNISTPKQLFSVDGEQPDGRNAKRH